MCLWSIQEQLLRRCTATGCELSSKHTLHPAVNLRKSHCDRKTHLAGTRWQTDPYTCDQVLKEEMVILWFYEHWQAIRLTNQHTPLFGTYCVSFNTICIYCQRFRSAGKGKVKDLLSLQIEINQQDFWFHTGVEQRSPGWNSCVSLTHPSTQSASACRVAFFILWHLTFCFWDLPLN